MDTKLVANYLAKLKEKCGLTYEVIAERSGQPVSTIKNLCSGKTENPGIVVLSAIMYAMGGSLDEMCTGQKDTAKEISISSIKEMYEYQLAEATKMNETHINNIRSHYEQHRQDIKDHTEHRLADKREIIEQQNEHIKTLKKELISSKLFSVICIAILVGLLIAEVMNPNLGWLRF